MTREETIQILSVLKTAYPRFYANMTKVDANNAIDLWAAMFAEDEFPLVSLALKKLIATKEFPPTISELRQALAQVQHDRMPDAGEAWEEIIGAVRKYGYYRAEEAMATMRPATKQAVRHMDWYALCLSEEPMADRAHFLKIYGMVEHREREKMLIPHSVQDAIAKLTGGDEHGLLSMQGQGSCALDGNSQGHTD